MNRIIKYVKIGNIRYKITGKKNVNGLTLAICKFLYDGKWHEVKNLQKCCEIAHIVF